MAHRKLRFSLLALLIAVAAPSAAARKVVIKLGTLAPDGSPWHLILEDMAEQWRDASDGRVVVRIYPGGRAGDEPDMVRKMRIGQLHGAALTVVGLSAISRGPKVLSIPGMYASYDELDRVREALAPELERRLRARGFVVLDWADAGWVRFVTTRAASSPSDLKAMKLFAWSGGSQTVDLWREFGFRPVPLAATDILPGLQTGLIDAAPMTALSALSTQAFTVAPHMIDVRWAPLAGAVVVSEDVWLRIPPAVRGQLALVARRTGERLRSEIRELDREALDAMRARGLTVHPVGDELAATWRRLAESAYPLVRGELVPSDLFDRALAVRDRQRAATAGDASLTATLP